MKKQKPEKMPRILTVAGSDSGGGAGIQGDLKTISVLGGFGLSAITAVTAQNTRGITGIWEVPPEFVAEQIEAVLADIGADAVKTGMLVNAAIVRVVAEKVRRYRISRLVVDPVLISSSGRRLLAVDAEQALAKELIPLARVFTPNVPECAALTGKRIRTREQMRAAARVFHEMGARSVLVKGGHLPGQPVDIFFDGSTFHELRGRRISTRHLHGTGCTLSAAIAVELAKGSSGLEAVTRAKDFITSAIESALPLGHGCGPVNPLGAAIKGCARRTGIPGGQN